MKTLWYYFIKAVIKTSLFFYSKKITVVGKGNIPKKGAVLFMVNHPNGLLDPLVVATNNPRIQHFLVRAAVFKKPTIKKLLGTLNLMPIYRIRDGVKELSKNQEIFETCYQILKEEKALMIFPEGSHNRMRTVRPLSKGFTRIVFGALEVNPNLKIHIVPVGLTYQNASVYPSKIALHYGSPILANDYYSQDNQNAEIVRLKQDVKDQMQQLSVHIPFNETYHDILNKLNELNTDFTQVDKVNRMIKDGEFPKRKGKSNWIHWMKPLLILNTLVPYLIWKQTQSKIDEIEFIDTFRFGLNTVLVFVFYTIHTILIKVFLNTEMAFLYIISSLLLIIIYSKLNTTPAESHLE